MVATHSGRISEVYRVAEIVIGLSEKAEVADLDIPSAVSRPHSFENRPATVFLVAAGPLLTGIVE